jgi:hypothetical protein
VEEGLERLYERLRVERNTVRFLLADPVFHRAVCFDMHTDRIYLVPLSWFRRRLRGALATFTYKWELAGEERRLLGLLLETGAVKLEPPQGRIEAKIDWWLVVRDPEVKAECLKLLPEVVKKALGGGDEDED